VIGGFSPLDLAARIAAQCRHRDRDDAVLAHLELAERHAAAVALVFELGGADFSRSTALPALVVSTRDAPSTSGGTTKPGVTLIST
jgi:hypothetical protein